MPQKATQKIPNNITPELVIGARSELCKRSFLRFVEEFWSVVVTQPLVPNWHIEVLCEELQRMGLLVVLRRHKEQDLVINVPPGSSKSTIVSILFPAWLWAMDPSISVISASYSMSIAMELSTKSRDVIKSDKFKQYFPHVVLRQDVDAKSNYSTNRQGSRYTTSNGGAVTGLHADVIIVDDPQNPLGAESEAERRTTNEWVTGTLSTRKRDQGVTPTIVVQQRLHRDDVTGYVLGRETGWKHVSIPAELTETCKPIPKKLESKYVRGLMDPVRLPRTVLEAQKSRMGSRAYSAQMLQNPQDSSDSIIKLSWLPIISAPPIGPIDFWIDTAYTTKTSNDPSAIVATVFDPMIRHLTIVGAWHGHLESPQLMQHIQFYVGQNGGTKQSRIRIEPTAAGKSIVPMLLASTDLNVSESKAPTKSKLEMLYLVAPQFESLRVSMLRGPWNSLITDELFVNEPQHDDVRDCLVMAVNECLVDMPSYGHYSLLPIGSNPLSHAATEELEKLANMIEIEGYQPDRMPTYVGKGKYHLI